MKLLKSIIVKLCLIAVVVSCAKKDKPVIVNNTFEIDFEKFTLDNGLQVILHIDRSDPVVAVSLTSHVGSAREIEGRTGFAHLFEHLLFLESENLGKGGLDKLSARIGGSGANGSTNRDRTNYLQTVPKDALEKMIWAEADKLGYFINTVTDEVLAKEKQVVKNEKRQSVDNRPYGHTFKVIGDNLYPKGHPYSWTVIGSLEDLQNATLQDVKDFFNKWYVPNNVTLTIAGDFDTIQTKKWVEKYFSDIKRGADIPEMEKQPVVLNETKKVYYEDNFARLPQLNIAWPTVHQYHPDAYGLEVLTTYLSQGKKAPLYKTLVEDEQLTDVVYMYQNGFEIAGQLMLEVTAFSETDLDTIERSIFNSFTEFETNGISLEDLNRIKAGQETDFYNSFSSVLGKGVQLAQYEIFAGNPGFVNQDVQNILAVTPEDVMRVYNTYIKGKHYVATSFVPKNQINLGLENSVEASVVEEQIVEGAEEQFDASIAATYEKTPSSFDRSIEPPYGESLEVTIPIVWKDKLSSGIAVYGIENNEVPLVQFQMEIKGGLLLEEANKVGVSNLLADLLTKGTKNKTPEVLEQAIESLGATINVYATDEALIISGNTLAKHYKKTMDLVKEILLEPRWDKKQFNLIKQSILSSIDQQKASPDAIADKAFYKLTYGENHILSNAVIGTEASVNAISIEDLQLYYNNNISSTVSKFHVVGAISKAEVMSSLTTINKKWTVKDVSFPKLPELNAPAEAQVYFYDVPGAKQSVLRFGYPALAVTDVDYYPATVMNYRLGGGGFASQFTQQLREGKGYTYGISSSFSGSHIKGPFTIASGVRSNVTFEAIRLVKEILENYSKNYNENDLEVTKGFMIKSNARAFETFGAKLNMLKTLSAYGFEDDFVKQREAIVKAMTVTDIKNLADKYLNPNKMIYLVVGDASTQLAKLEQLGFGKPILLNE